MKPIYFDLSVRDLAQSRGFFEQVLGWHFERFPGMPYEYWRIRTGDESEQGIDGGMGALADAPLAQGRPLALLTVAVQDLEAVLAAVQAHGGRVVEPKTAIPTIGWYATCAEPGGLLFGLLQPDPGAAGAGD